MNRRSFLGSVIGICTATLIPIKAVEIVAGIITPAAPKDDLDKFKLGYVFDVEGEIDIWATGVKDVDIKNTQIVWQLNDIDIRTTGVAKGIVLYSPNGRICSIKKFDYPPRLYPEDILKISYTISIEGANPREWSVWEPKLFQQYKELNRNTQG